MKKETKSYKLLNILSNGKAIHNKENGIIKMSFPFDFSISNKESNNTIIFENINEAVETISEFAEKENSEKIKQQLLNNLKDNFIIEKSFIVEFKVLE